MQRRRKVRRNKCRCGLSYFDIVTACSFCIICLWEVLRVSPVFLDVVLLCWWYQLYLTLVFFNVCCRWLLWTVGRVSFVSTFRWNDHGGVVLVDCEMNVHKNCLERVRDVCLPSGSSPGGSGTVRKRREKPRQQSVFDKLMRKPSSNSPAASM